MNVFYDAEFIVQHLWDQNNAMFGEKYLTELPESLYYPNVNTWDKIDWLVTFNVKYILIKANVLFQFVL